MITFQLVYKVFENRKNEEKLNQTLRKQKTKQNCFIKNNNDTSPHSYTGCIKSLATRIWKKELNRS